MKQRPYAATKPKIFTIWLITEKEKVCQPLAYNNEIIEWWGRKKARDRFKQFIGLMRPRILGSKSFQSSICSMEN